MEALAQCLYIEFDEGLKHDSAGWVSFSPEYVSLGTEQACPLQPPSGGGPSRTTISVREDGARSF